MRSSLPGRAFAAAVVVLLCASAPGLAQDGAVNAALPYWQAFGFLPKMEIKQIEIIADVENVKLDEDARELIRSAETSLKYYHRGGRQKSCDWGLDFDEGIMLLLPHLDRGRTLA